MSSYKGVVYILISTVFYASYGVWSKVMGSSFGEFSQAWTRGLVLLVVILLLNSKYRFLKKISKQDLPWFMLIALAGGINQAPYYFGFQHLQIGTATLLFYASLVVGGYVISKVFLNENINSTKLFSLGLAVVGMLLIYGFSLATAQFLAAGLTCIAGLLGAAAVVLTKKLSRTYHELHIMIGYFALQVVINAPLAILTQEIVPSFTDTTAWIAQVLYALSMLVANFAVIEGFKYVDGSIGSLIGLAEVLFGALFGWLFFSETFSAFTLIGGVLIIIAAAYPSITYKSSKSA
jgi:drug/metabolite transporter (DMT)-like permease